MDKIYSHNRSDLFEKLSIVDISVPLRSEGRKSKHCERWSICLWLSTIPNLEFPLTLVHQDKPDFYLKTGTNEYGIECTEAIPEDYAQAIAISEKNSNKTSPEMSLFTWDQKKTFKEIYEITKRTKLSGPGWEGDYPEHEWACCMLEITMAKNVLIQKPEFKKFSNNFLLIYDNLPLPAIDYSKASTCLMSKLDNYWNGKLVFDTIFVQTDKLLMKFTCSGVDEFNVINLWCS